MALGFIASSLVHVLARVPSSAIDPVGSRESVRPIGRIARFEVRLDTYFYLVPGIARQFRYLILEPFEGALIQIGEPVSDCLAIARYDVQAVGRAAELISDAAPA